MGATSGQQAAASLLLIGCHLVGLSALAPGQGAEPRTGTIAPSYANRSDFYAWLQQGRPARANNAAGDKQTRPPAGGFAVEVAPPASSQLFQYQPTELSRQTGPSAGALPPAQNRSARTASLISYDELEGDEYNLLVSNTCERDSMTIEVKTNKPFHGIIHTLNHRRKPICSAEGDGGNQFRLSISHALNPNDPQYCGVTLVARGRPASEPPAEWLSVIVVVRLNRNIELSEDKFFALNCTK